MENIGFVATRHEEQNPRRTQTQSGVAKMYRVVFKRVPKCSTPEQYFAWVEVARIVPPGKAGFCTDCTPEYAALMRSIGLCENTFIEFDKDGDGYVPAYKHLETY